MVERKGAVGALDRVSDAERAVCDCVGGGAADCGAGEGDEGAGEREGGADAGGGCGGGGGGEGEGAVRGCDEGRGGRGV